MDTMTCSDEVAVRQNTRMLATRLGIERMHTAAHRPLWGRETMAGLADGGGAAGTA